MRIRWYRTFVGRLLFALVGLAQSALPGASAVYEGTLGMSASPASTRAHAEEGRQAGCSLVHAPECVVCAALLVLAAPPRTADHTAAARRPLRAPASLDAGIAAPLLALARPRAPPLV